jgi:TPR repeat protein
MVIPDSLYCPITLEPMEDPVMLYPTGHSYDRRAISMWLLRNPDKDPKGGVVDEPFSLVPNYGLRALLDHFGLSWREHVEQDFDNRYREAWSRRGLQRYSLAILHLQLAADLGNAEAQYSLGRCYANGTGVPQDSAEAARLYTLAADQEYAEAQNSLGVCYANGNGVPQDRTQAVRLFQLAADQEYAEAQHNLGTCYQTGRGIPEDTTEEDRMREAARLYRLAADQGYVQALYNLAKCYSDGFGVPQDMEEAKRVYVRAVILDEDMDEAMKLFVLAVMLGQAQNEE